MEKKLLSMTATVGIPACHPDFAGHFPGFPLLPAVSQISLIKSLLEQQLGHSIECIHVTKTKFKAMLRPNSEVLVDLDWHHDGEARWQIYDKDHAYSIGRMLFRTCEA